MTNIQEPLPQHVGLILDGNRRWAKQQGKTALEGHRKGSETFKKIALHAFRRGITYVSGFVFSTENWQRTEEEVGYLMTLVVRAVDDYLETFHKEGIKIVILGRRDGLRNKVLKAIQRAEETTKNNTNGTLALCFNYGGKQEIVDSCNSAIREGKQMITEDDLSNHLYSPEIPAIDLLIRTSGERRLSGFMLWRAVYAELFFSTSYWPAFTTAEFDQSILDYSERHRRFGV